MARNLTPNPDEVECIISVPLSYFVENGSNPDVIAITDEAPKARSAYADYLKQFGLNTTKRCYVFIQDEYFHGDIKPVINFFYGINASLIVFISYLFEKEECEARGGATSNKRSYARALAQMNENFAPFGILEYPSQVRIGSYHMYKNYLSERKRKIKSKI